jgi:glycine dehydrogenase subunit 1
MPFIAHTEKDLADMLETIGVSQLEDLFDEVPTGLQIDGLNLPNGLHEQSVSREAKKRAAADGEPLSFIGAGAYAHHIPALVWELTTRGEFYTAYTPYQAEASQGTLQLLYEYQSMMTALVKLPVSNASLYDGASALAEAALMAVRSKRVRRILVPSTVHPNYRKVLVSLVQNQGIQVVTLPYAETEGRLLPETLTSYAEDKAAALVIPQPNFFGTLEAVDALTDWAHEQGMLVIAQVNPLAMSLLKPPGEWGNKGADIACGEGQPLGIPLSSGGPYYGFLCCTKALMRQLPGRIVGRTLDIDGKPGFTLTLQAREQHIRRARATSNICTNQGLMVTASTLHMATMGADGLYWAASQSHAKSRVLCDKLTALDGVEKVFDGAFFHEVVVRFPVPIDDLMRSMHADNILPGFVLHHDYPELENALLVCATECTEEEDIDHFVEHLSRVLSV